MGTGAFGEWYWGSLILVVSGLAANVYSVARDDGNGGKEKQFLGDTLVEAEQFV
jgi:hypothetical protein